MDLLRFTIYERLGQGELTPMNIALHLVHSSTRLPKECCRRVLIKAAQFIFPDYFVVLDIENVPNVDCHVPMILGCPFIVNSNALTNCRHGMMNVSFDNVTLDLNIFNLQDTLMALMMWNFSPLIGWVIFLMTS